MIIADYTTGTTRLATHDEVVTHQQGHELRLARDRGWPLPKEDIDKSHAGLKQMDQ